MSPRVALDRRLLMSAGEIERIIARLAHQIVEPQDAQEGLYIIGVRRGGETLAYRIAEKIAAISGSAPALGFLNINLYRDDDIAHNLPESSIPSDINDQTVVIVDDVLYTGRTVRSALDAVTDLGRPCAIRLCVLIDRGQREIPVQGDYVGRVVPTSRRERVEVRISRRYDPSDEVAVIADEA